VVRQDGSGTTFAFTKNLDAVSEKWRSQFGPATLVNWPGNAMRAKGNEGVASLIRNSADSIGYVGYEFARKIGLASATFSTRIGIKFFSGYEGEKASWFQGVRVSKRL